MTALRSWTLEFSPKRGEIAEILCNVWHQMAYSALLTRQLRSHYDLMRSQYDQYGVLDALPLRSVLSQFVLVVVIELSIRSKCVCYQLIMSEMRV